MRGRSPLAAVFAQVTVESAKLPGREKEGTYRDYLFRLSTYRVQPMFGLQTSGWRSACPSRSMTSQCLSWCMD
jgi:hypothetical protein